MTRTLYAIRPLPLPLGSLGYENAIWVERRMLELNSYRRAGESWSDDGSQRRARSREKRCECAHIFSWPSY
jgi:hypothetical protein